MTGRVNKLIYWRVFPIYGMSSFPLTNSMIFQDGWNHQPATTEGLFSPKISDRWQKADADCACVEGCSEIGYTVQLGMVLTKFIELDDGKIYRKALYLMVKTMVSCRFSLKSIASCADVWIAVSPTIFPRQPPEVLAALVGESSRGWATHWCHQTWLAGKSPIKMEVWWDNHLEIADFPLPCYWRVDVP